MKLLRGGVRSVCFDAVLWSLKCCMLTTSTMYDHITSTIVSKHIRS